MRNNFQHAQRLVLLSLLALSSGCGALQEPNESGSVARNTSPQLNDNDALAKYLAPIDPELAQLSLDSEPFLAAASEGSTLRVPTISLTGFEEKRADYMQIARCAAGTSLRAPTGEKLEDIPLDSSTRLRSLKWIWINSVWGDSVNCKLVGGVAAHNSRSKFQDLSAKTGRFFYVINPCIRSERSTSKETCSYNLVVTKEFAYENALTAQFSQLAEELSMAEGRLAGLYSQLYYDSQILRLRKNECENKYAVTESSKNFWKGVLSLSLGGVGATVGLVMSGGTAALQGFKTGLGIAVGFFKKIPPTPNVCPVADKIIQDAQATSAAIPTVVQRVLEIRVSMSQIETTYGKIDQSILNSEKDSSQ